jgi:methylated-DNA-[protein]-cysteine S-methyltransferase
VRVTRHPYDVPGWGVGEVWVREGVVIQHELASESLRREHEAAAAERGDDVAVLLGVADDAGASDLKGARGSGGSRADAGPARRDAPSLVSPNGGARRPARTLPAKPSSDRATFVPDLCRRFAEHLAGVPTSYDDVPLELDWATPLQQEFAAAARAIPWGEVVSYGELAILAGRPGAARAAGSFCADNRFSLIIPCHRIVAANGIGGYGSAGLGLKRRLLALEGVHL